MSRPHRPLWPPPGPRITPPGRAIRNIAIDGDNFQSDNSENSEKTLQTCYVYNPYTFVMVLRGGARQSVGTAGSVGRTSVDGSSLRMPHSGPGSDDGCGPSSGQQSKIAGRDAAAGACHCSLNLGHLLEDPCVDLPSPPPPISRCELHELLRALPPRLQNHPWRLAYDTSRDGFSLRNFYRTMESVYHDGSCAIGIFFVTERARDTAVDGEPSEESGDATPLATSSGSRLKSSTADAAGSHSTGSSVYQGQRVGIIGCFTPKVPCLEAHGHRHYAFYGSEETFVFRLHQGGKRARFSGLRSAARVTRATAPMSTGSGPHLSPSKGEERRMCGSGDGPHPGSSPRRPTALSVPPSLAGARRTLQSLEGKTTALHSVFYDPSASTQMLPSATWEGPQRSTSSSAGHRRHSSPAQSSVSTTTDSTAAASTGVDGRGTAVPGDNAVYAQSPVHRGDGTMVAYPLLTPASDANVTASPILDPRADYPPHIASSHHWPLIEKFSWSGKASSRQFILAQRAFFAIGGGPGGAALLVDNNLQFCTSSTRCDTFDSPALFGRPRAGGLNHTELAIVRTLWFAVAHGSANEFRVMTYTGEEDQAMAREACDCGRPCADSQEGVQPGSRIPTHRCNDGFFAF